MEDEQEEEYGDQLNNYEVHNIASYGQDQMTLEQQQYAQQMASLQSQNNSEKALKMREEVQR
jgi:hypothetical protein